MNEENNYNQPIDAVPARVRALVKDSHTQANVIHWVPVETPHLNPEDFE